MRDVASRGRRSKSTGDACTESNPLFIPQQVGLDAKRGKVLVGERRQIVDSVTPAEPEKSPEDTAEKDTDKEKEKEREKGKEKENASESIAGITRPTIANLNIPAANERTKLWNNFFGRLVVSPRLNKNTREAEALFSPEEKQSESGTSEPPIVDDSLPGNISHPDFAGNLFSSSLQQSTQVSRRPSITCSVMNQRSKLKGCTTSTCSLLMVRTALSGKIVLTHAIAFPSSIQLTLMVLFAERNRYLPSRQSSTLGMIPFSTAPSLLYSN